jgi:LPXTG-motif cell wall-anchored protein
MRTRSLAGSLFAATVAVLGLSALLAVSAGAQVNGARLGIGPTIPTSTTVGAKGVPVYISLTNLSEPTDGTLIIPPDSITFTPSCGSLPGGAVPPCPNPDPGVFSVSPTGIGRKNTNCDGKTYSISQISPATGEMRLIGPAITLDGSDPNTRVGGTCIIDMTVDVMRAPTIDGDPLTPGIQTYQLVNTAGWHTALNNTASCCGSSHTTVVPAAPGLNTQASPPVTLGGQISDTATLTGGVSPTGTIIFKFFLPADTNCVGPPAFTSPPVAVNGPGAYTSPPYTPTVVGTFRTIASYSGNASNTPVTTKCNDTGESVVVNAPPTKPPTPTPTPSTSVLGASINKKPTLPVTGPSLPIGPLGLLGIALVAVGAALLRRKRRSGAA